MLANTLAIALPDKKEDKSSNTPAPTAQTSPESTTPIADPKPEPTQVVVEKAAQEPPGVEKPPRTLTDAELEWVVKAANHLAELNTRIHAIASLMLEASANETLLSDPSWRSKIDKNLSDTIAFCNEAIALSAPPEFEEYDTMLDTSLRLFASGCIKLRNGIRDYDFDLMDQGSEEIELASKSMFNFTNEMKEVAKEYGVSR